MQTIIAADIGGTHARFALAQIDDGRVASLGAPVTLRTADHADFASAWRSFCAGLDEALPRAAAIAVATPVGSEVVRFTNNPWVIRPADLAAELGLDEHILINDFGAVAHAVAQAKPMDLLHLCGPDRALPADGIITICGPGTGLGVAQLLWVDGNYQALATEGGHVGFAPLDDVRGRAGRAFARKIRTRVGGTGGFRSRPARDPRRSDRG